MDTIRTARSEGDARAILTGHGRDSLLATSTRAAPRSLPTGGGWNWWCLYCVLRADAALCLAQRASHSVRSNLTATQRASGLPARARRRVVGATSRSTEVTVAPSRSTRARIAPSVVVLSRRVRLMRDKVPAGWRGQQLTNKHTKKPTVQFPQARREVQRVKRLRTERGIRRKAAGNSR